jgi:hypothetical protein
MIPVVASEARQSRKAESIGWEIATALRASQRRINQLPYIFSKVRTRRHLDGF